VEKTTSILKKSEIPKNMNSSQISEKIREIVGYAKQLEATGKYAEAVSSLSLYWTSSKDFPNVSELNTIEQAEVFLRCGSLTSNLGICQQTKNAQELAQQMLKQALELFSALELEEKVADCEAHLATTYLRRGELNEARVWIDTAFQHKIEESSETRLYSHIIDCLILLAEKRYVALVNNCAKLEAVFQSSIFYVLQADFNNNYAVGLMRTGDKKYALKKFNLAKSFYKQTKHYLSLAALENNLAIFHETEEEYKEAHKSVLSAIDNYKRAGDKNHQGYSIDTQAHIFMSEGKYVEALACANEAIRMLSDGENYCYLENAIQTKSHIQLYLKDYSELAKTIVEAIRIVNLFSDKPDKRISTIKETISSNFQKCWTVDELAETINLSKSRFKELFKQKTQLSPIQFVRHLRFERAKELLKITHLTVKEISFAVGINDQSHFVRDFKKKYGTSPTEYRNKF
jgi:AraC-like DNA-binding protein